MIVTLDGVRCNVPDAYQTRYSEDTKLAILQMVIRLKKRLGKHLVAVYVFRVMRQDTEHPRIDGGWTTQ